MPLPAHAAPDSINNENEKAKKKHQEFLYAILLVAGLVFQLCWTAPPGCPANRNSDPRPLIRTLIEAVEIPWSWIRRPLSSFFSDLLGWASGHARQWVRRIDVGFMGAEAWYQTTLVPGLRKVDISCLENLDMVIWGT